MPDSDLHSRLKAAVEQRLAEARRAEDNMCRYECDPWCGDFHQTNDPATVIRHCERDLRVLERHKASQMTDTFGDCWNCAPGAPNELVRDCAVPWPCPEITDLAAAYGIEADDA